MQDQEAAIRASCTLMTAHEQIAELIQGQNPSAPMAAYGHEEKHEI
jgi:hypothetical protein